jgi:hypothetical protein
MTRPDPPSPADRVRAALAAAYEQSAILRGCSTRFGISPPVVARLLREDGVTLRPARGRPARQDSVLLAPRRRLPPGRRRGGRAGPGTCCQARLRPRGRSQDIDLVPGSELSGMGLVPVIWWRPGSAGVPGAGCGIFCVRPGRSASLRPAGRREGSR